MIRLSLALRFKLGAAFSILIVLISGFLSVFYLHSINDEIQSALRTDLHLLRLIERGTLSLESSLAREVLALRPGSEPASCSDLIDELRLVRSELKTYFGTLGRMGATETAILGEFHDYESALSRVGLATPGQQLPLVIDLLERRRILINHLSRLDNNRRQAVAQHLGILAEINKTAQGRMALFAIITISIAIGLSVFFTQQITLPVRRLKELIARIRDGDYDISARPQADDEIGQIFNTLVRAAENIAIRDRLKIEKIDLERRRFATLANHIGIPLLLINSKNQIAHASNGALELFRLAYDDLFEIEVSRAPLASKLKEHLTFEAKKGDYPVDQPIVYATEPKESAVSLTIVPVENARGEVVSLICLMMPMG